MAAVTMLTEIRFWQQVLTDAHRIVYCSPELESRIKGWIDARNLGGQFEVRAQRWMPDDRIYIIDDNAIRAEQAKAPRHPGEG